MELVSMEPVRQRISLSYLRELKEELGKVHWTTAEELKLSTQMVVGTTFVLGLGIYLADLAIKAVIHGFDGLVHTIFG